MAVLIPLRTDLVYYDLQISLDSVVYTLLLRWNLRETAWYMDVFDETGQTLYQAGINIVVNYYLCTIRTGRKPDGVFLALDTSGENLDPGVNDLGDRVILYYFSLSDLGG